MLCFFLLFVIEFVVVGFCAVVFFDRWCVLFVSVFVFACVLLLCVCHFVCVGWICLVLLFRFLKTRRASGIPTNWLAMETTARETTMQCLVLLVFLFV